MAYHNTDGKKSQSEHKKSQYEIDRESIPENLCIDEYAYDSIIKVLDPITQSQYAQDRYLSWMENELTSLNPLSKKKTSHPTENPYTSSLTSYLKIIPNNIDNMQNLIKHAKSIENMLIRT